LTRSRQDPNLYICNSPSLFGGWVRDRPQGRSQCVRASPDLPTAPGLFPGPCSRELPSRMARLRSSWTRAERPFAAALNSATETRPVAIERAAAAITTLGSPEARPGSGGFGAWPAPRGPTRPRPLHRRPPDGHRAQHRPLSRPGTRWPQSPSPRPGGSSRTCNMIARESLQFLQWPFAVPRIIA
jgi:hypothetical protein